VVIVLAMGLSGFLLLSFLERYFLQATEDSLLAQARITAQALIPGAMTEGPPGGEIPAQGTDRLAPIYNTTQQQVGNLALQAENLSLPPENLSPGDSDLSYLADVSLQFSTQLETRIRILDAQGIVLVDTQGQEGGADLGSDSLVAQALEVGYASRTDETGRETIMYVVLPVQVDNQLVGVVYLSQPLSDVAAVLHDLRTRWLLATGIALLLSGVVGLLLSGAITRPLRRLTTAAGAVAHGQFDRQMQSDFVANVSHELRTPLTSIKGMLETLRGGAVHDPEVRDAFLETAESETDRLIRLVNDLLLLSRADSAALTLRRESTHVVELVRATVDRLTPQAQAKNLAVQVEARPDTPRVWIDPDRIEQVLVNLLDNAIKYSRPRASVVVTVSSGSDRSALVQVRDQGIGIPAEDLLHIGQRFYRADKARSRADGGSGLGLAIAQALVEAHGGRLWLESQEGQGTLVSFTLPSA
jgi:signal transduction histidine kinase